MLNRNPLLMSWAQRAWSMQAGVSILVFVELALDVLKPRYHAQDGISFNPCFRGTCSWWSNLAVKLSIKLKVSILVFVELALDGHISDGNSEWHNVSILVFVELALDVETDTTGIFELLCFNPCFRGTCSWCPGLLEVAGLVKESFNPCFRGTCSWCADCSCHYTGRDSVSILVFVELALDARPFGGSRSCKGEFQSLFSWNLLLMRRLQLPLYRQGLGFNPCFRGTCSWCQAFWR